MSWSSRIRRAHRWLGIVFAATVIVAAITVATPHPVAVLYFVPLFPMALLIPSGVFLFVLPYVERRRETRSQPA